MIDIVIIGQNECNSIIPMFESLRYFNCNRIWVLDRCTDDSERILSDLGERYIKTPDNLIGRQTCFSRNLGLKYTNRDNDVIFLDLKRPIVSWNINELYYSKTDIQLFSLKNDFRRRWVFKFHYGTKDSGFYSGGLFFKRHAINKILDFQNGQFFKVDLQKNWGIEDVYLGDVCYHLGLTCDLNKNIILYGEFSDKKPDSSTLNIWYELRKNLNVI